MDNDSKLDGIFEFECWKVLLETNRSWKEFKKNYIL